MAAPRGIVAIAVVLVAVAGAAVRVLSGNALLHTDLVYSPAQKERIPGATSPENAARSFYLYIDSGLYDKAYDISIEPQWNEGVSRGSGFDKVSGRSSREDFFARMYRELGPGGSGIRLGGIRAGEAEPVDDFSAIERLEGVYRVRVSGHMLGACSVFRWKKDLTVLKTAGQYKVLLDGRTGALPFSYRSWFENIEKISDLRVGGKSRVIK
jgi:hypothetical protein